MFVPRHSSRHNDRQSIRSLQAPSSSLQVSRRSLAELAGRAWSKRGPVHREMENKTDTSKTRPKELCAIRKCSYACQTSRELVFHYCRIMPSSAVSGCRTLACCRSCLTLQEQVGEAQLLSRIRRRPCMIFQQLTYFTGGFEAHKCTTSRQTASVHADVSAGC
jgi:hypothetical protein